MNVYELFRITAHCYNVEDQFPVIIYMYTETIRM